MFGDCTFNSHISSLPKKFANWSGWILGTFYTRDCNTLLILFKLPVLLQNTSVIHQTVCMICLIMNVYLENC